MKRILTEPIKFYRENISPYTPPSCRYHPTCSSYALQAIEKHGAVKGGVMATARILRCNPFIEGGVDEVPDYFTIFRNPDNIDDFHFPDYMMPMDKEAQTELSRLLDKYKEDLNVYEKLPSALETLEKMADITLLEPQDIKKEFTKDELDYLIDIEIFPDLNSEAYRYYTIEATEKNKFYLHDSRPYFEETDIGEDFPLIVLEKPGIWYTNLPKLGRDYLIQRGVTQEDINQRSYHLWLVLQAIDEAQTNENE